tara:strand:- start:147 stop:374 length:228 start_codon:yes stop_codon:yes gene_type:complete
MTNTIWVYNQNCTMAGHAVPQRLIDQCDDPSDHGDWHEEVLNEEHAAMHEATAKTCGAGDDIYHLRIAKTIRSML